MKTKKILIIGWRVQLPTCSVCGSKLKNITSRHIKSKKHQDALKKSKTKPSIDQALKLTGAESKSRSSTKSSNQIVDRLTRIEKVIKDLKSNQNRILMQLKNLSLDSTKPLTIKAKKLLQSRDILSAINKCVQNNQNHSRWIKIDDVISILKLNHEEDRIYLYKDLVKMFTQNVVDLAEGGDPKYPLNYQNREYGMVALQ